MTFIPAPKRFKTVSLEMSLKPFFDNSPETRRAVCRKLFRQWLPLCEHADEVHVMLWTADGSEILDYRGDMDAELEWARYVGGANRGHATESADAGLADEKDTQGIGMHSDAADPKGIGLHRRPYHYRKDPAVLTYQWLKDLVADLKREGARILEIPVKVGNTFDPGPEFAKSPFKYERHNEICLGGALYGKTFVGCSAVLHGDEVAYAGFPTGIPEGTSLGTFMGRQLKHFNRDLDMDFIWFSNGFGFGVETWGLNGSTFDGYKFIPENIGGMADGIRRFWQDLRHEVPNLLVRTRGTNLTSGIDMASDGAPLADIYKYGPLEPPVNSPWAALDGDFGLELAGWMSHIAELPGEGFPFRFYTHDPWWMNSPWIDRYQRFPHDLYMPLSVGRLNGKGAVETPSTIAFLSVDDSKGEMPAQVPADVTSHILRARENAPDQPGPLVWVYPFAEYNDAVFGEDPRLQEVYFGDWYIRGAINQGAPVNTVVSTTNYLSIDAGKLTGSILLTPVPNIGSPLRAQLLEQVRNGGRVLLYGPIASDDTELLKLLSLETAPPAEGDFELTLDTEWADADGVTYGKTLHHAAIISGGALTLTSNNSVATASQDGHTYALAAMTELGGGTLGWLRGTVTCDETRMGGPLPLPLDTGMFFPAESMVRLLVEHMGGIGIRHTKTDVSQRTPMHTVSRSSNGFFFSGYNASDVDGTHLQMRHGAPLFTGAHAIVDASGAHYRLPPAWHHECRLFVRQEQASKIECRELPSIHFGINRRILLTHLANAVVRFFPVQETETQVAVLADPAFPYLVGEFQTPRKVEDVDGTYFEVGPITGNLLFSW